MKLALIIASAVLLPLALPNEVLPAGLFIPGLVALAPAFLVVLRSSSRREASRYGALFGLLSTALANYWLAFFGEFSVWTIGGSVLGYTGYNYILFGYLYHLADPLAATGKRAFRPIVLAVAWTGYEYLKSTGFLAYPWGLIAYPIATDLRISQIAEITGVWGLSFLGAYINAAIAEVVYQRDARPLAILRRDPVVRPNRIFLRGAMPHILAAALLFLVAAGFGLYQLPRLTPRDEVEFVLVQQNVDSWEPGRFADALDRAQRLTVEELLVGMERGDPLPDAVVWSETSLRVPYDKNVDFYRSEPTVYPFYPFLRMIDTPLITGTPQRVGETGDYRNSAIVILPSGEKTGAYGKQQLVPFAESIPFWNSPAVQRFFRNVIGLTGSWVPGAGSQPLGLPLRDGTTMMIGTPICFEDGFGWVPREMVNNGADLLVNLTNNSWSRQDSAQTQHYAAARLRSIELRTTLVRGTNSGLSGVVDARGVLTAELPMFESTARRVSVPLYRSQWTLYRSLGDWFGILAALGTILLVIAGAFASRRTQKNRHP